MDLINHSNKTLGTIVVKLSHVIVMWPMVYLYGVASLFSIENECKAKVTNNTVTVLTPHKHVGWLYVPVWLVKVYDEWGCVHVGVGVCAGKLWKPYYYMYIWLEIIPYLNVTIICRYIFCGFWIQNILLVLNFVFCFGRDQILWYSL